MFNDLFLRTCRLEETERTPVWLMRQAGRYMKEYQEIRGRHSFLEMCKKPEIATQVTLQPVDALGVDAAILFSDILVPVEAMGVEVEFVENKGPVLRNKLERKEDVDSLIIPEPETHIPFVLDTIKLLRKKLEVPLIGFSGAPFTLASYMIEGGGSKNYIKTKSTMYNNPTLWTRIMEKISKTVIAYLDAQINAGVQAVQLFDSWVGCMGPEDYKKFVQPYTKEVIDSLTGDVPIIHFGTGTATLLEHMRETGGDVIGIDWRINLDDAWERIGYDRGIQGNLDPAALYAPPEEIIRRVKDILAKANARAGHVFNLGHGILPTTPVENVKLMVKAVKKYSLR
ncbi:MAG: uroporphyrinogen decarboxylase [Candidatus Hydrothermarchaeales archaeon]